MLKSDDEILLELCDRRIDLANKYATERKEFGEYKSAIDLKLAKKIMSMQEKKKNLGYEIAVLMLCAEDEEAQVINEKLVRAYNNYKAIEKMIEAVESRIISMQSIMRFFRTNENKGAY